MAAKGSRPSPSRNRAASSRLTASNKSASVNARRGTKRVGKTPQGKGKTSGKTSAKGKGQSKGVKTQKAAARRPNKKEGNLQAIPSPKPGFPLWIKFAIPTAFIIALLLVVEGLVISKQMVKNIEDQINKRGVDLVTQLAYNADPKLWIKVIPGDVVELDANASAADKKNYEKVIREHNKDIKYKLADSLSQGLRRIADNSRRGNKKAVKEIVEGGELETFGITAANILREIANPTKKDK